VFTPHGRQSGLERRAPVNGRPVPVGLIASSAAA
jgi:hypothetical protein